MKPSGPPRRGRTPIPAPPRFEAERWAEENCFWRLEAAAFCALFILACARRDAARQLALNGRLTAEERARGRGRRPSHLLLRRGSLALLELLLLLLGERAAVEAVHATPALLLRLTHRLLHHLLLEHLLTHHLLLLRRLLLLRGAHLLVVGVLLLLRARVAPAAVVLLLLLTRTHKHAQNRPVSPAVHRTTAGVGGARA